MSITISLDFETADNRPDSACAIGMARIENGVIESVYYSLIRPPRQAMLYTWVHGLTWNDVKNAPTFAELWADIDAFIAGADHLLAHNASFDRRVLYACCTAAGVAPPAQSFLCTLKGSRKALSLPSHKLNVLCEYYCIDLQHHNAESDASAAAHVFLRLCEQGISEETMRLK